VVAVNVQRGQHPFSVLNLPFAGKLVGFGIFKNLLACEELDGFILGANLCQKYINNIPIHPIAISQRQKCTKT
jgi:hypothetical protein